MYIIVAFLYYIVSEYSISHEKRSICENRSKIKTTLPFFTNMHEYYYKV